MRFNTVSDRQNADGCCCGASAAWDAGPPSASSVAAVTATVGRSSCKRCSTISNGVRMATLAASITGPARTIFLSRPTPPPESAPALTFLAA
eukprot:scaffold24646_cov129-Isochrysis_galbana.AAC.10